MKLLRFCLAVLAVGVPTLVLGATLPQQLIGTGADEYRGEQRDFAEYALAVAKAGEGWDLGPLVWAGRVTEVNTVSTGGRCGYAADVVGRYSAEVKLYSLFGVPYGRASVGCGDRSAYRLAGTLPDALMVVVSQVGGRASSSSHHPMTPRSHLGP